MRSSNDSTQPPPLPCHFTIPLKSVIILLFELIKQYQDISAIVENYNSTKTTVEESNERKSRITIQ
jgi:hypothetical protein